MTIDYVDKVGNAQEIFKMALRDKIFIGAALDETDPFCGHRSILGQTNEAQKGGIRIHDDYVVLTEIPRGNIVVPDIITIKGVHPTLDTAAQ